MMYVNLLVYLEPFKDGQIQKRDFVLAPQITLLQMEHNFDIVSMSTALFNLYTHRHIIHVFAWAVCGAICSYFLPLIYNVIKMTHQTSCVSWTRSVLWH